MSSAPRIGRAAGSARDPHARAFAAVGAVAGVVGAGAGLVFGAHAQRWLGPLRVRAELALDPSGGTRLDVPPLGAAQLRTHRGPLQVRLLAVDTDPNRARGLLRMPDGPADADAVRAQLHAALGEVGRAARGLARDLAVRAAVSGIAGAALAGLAIVRRPRGVRVGTLAGIAALGAGAGVAAVTTDRDAWRDPQLTGLLIDAPVILGDLRSAPQRVETYRDQLADLLRTGTGVYQRIANLPAEPPPDAIRLLHVSDVHLSPLAYPLARALVDEYRIDAVIDTGDVVDWGTPAEQALVGQVGEFGVPYVYVKGNHDSAGIAEAVGRQPNATVLDGETEPVEVAGLRMVGLADPRFTPDKTTGDDRAGHKVIEAADAFAARLRAAGTQADIALIHSPTGGRRLAGLVPLVLSGDTHIRAARRVGDTIVLTEGTSGGAGLRGVQAEPPVPLSMSVLYLERTTKALWGVDEITLGGLGAVQLSVVRKAVGVLLGESDAAPATEPVR